MIRAPDSVAIHAAEARVAQSGRDARDGLARAAVAFRTNLARPSTLALAAGAGGMLAVWLARRPRRPSDRENVARTVSTAGLAAAAMLRYGIEYWPLLLRLVGTRHGISPPRGL